jgi:valyl-tRNA synthetase
MPHGAAQAVVDEATVALPLAGVIDLASKRTRLQKEREAEAGKIARKLDNACFVASAPQEVVEENRDRLQAVREEIPRLDAAL